VHLAAVFGVRLSGGPPWPVVIDARRRASSLAHPAFARWIELVALLDAPVRVVLRRADGQQLELGLEEATPGALSVLWSPPTIPEGARAVRR